MKTHTLEAGQFIDFINPWKVWNTEWNDVNCGNTNEMSMWPSQWNPGLFRNCLNCDSLRWSHAHFICIPAGHIISFSIYQANKILVYHQMLKIYFVLFFWISLAAFLNYTTVDQNTKIRYINKCLMLKFAAQKQANIFCVGYLFSNIQTFLILSQPHILGKCLKFILFQFSFLKYTNISNNIS